MGETVKKKEGKLKGWERKNEIEKVGGCGGKGKKKK